MYSSQAPDVARAKGNYGSLKHLNLTCQYAEMSSITTRHSPTCQQAIVPAAIALVPALLRSALKVKVIVPQSVVPGPMFVYLLLPDVDLWFPLSGRVAINLW